MGVYWHYLNDAKKEYVSLSDLRDGGDKENAAIYCSEALAFLMIGPPYRETCHGRWHDDHVKIEADYSRCTSDLDERGYSNISGILLQDLREYFAGDPDNRFAKGEQSPRWEKQGYEDPRVVP